MNDSIDEDLVKALIEFSGDPIASLKSRIDSPTVFENIENPKYGELIIRAASVITSELQNYTVSVMTFERSADLEYTIGDTTFTKPQLMRAPIQLCLNYDLA